MWIDSWLCGVANGQRSRPKTMLGPGRNCQLTREEIYDMQSRQCEWDVSVRGQERSRLLGRPLIQGRS
jgi:hypothetical protein